MADELRIGFSELLRKARMEHDMDFLKEGVRVLSQALMEMEEEHIGASLHQRTDTRTGHRNGYRQRSLEDIRRSSQSPEYRMPSPPADSRCRPWSTPQLPAQPSRSLAAASTARP